MRNKFLNTGRPGFRPLQKLKVCMAGLRYAVLVDCVIHLDRRVRDQITTRRLRLQKYHGFACRRMGSDHAIFDYLIRIIDHCKPRGITTLLTNLIYQKEEKQ